MLWRLLLWCLNHWKADWMSVVLSSQIPYETETSAHLYLPSDDRRMLRLDFKDFQYLSSTPCHLPPTWSVNNRLSFSSFRIHQTDKVGLLQHQYSVIWKKNLPTSPRYQLLRNSNDNCVPATYIRCTFVTHCNVCIPYSTQKKWLEKSALSIMKTFQGHITSFVFKLFIIQKHVKPFLILIRHSCKIPIR